jgi:hypothetical protein
MLSGLNFLSALEARRGGERMNRKVLVTFVVLMAVATLTLCVVVPVMAEPKEQRVPASLWVAGIPTEREPGYSWFTNGGVHTRGRIEVIPSMLKIGDALPVKVFSLNVEDSSWNPKTGVMIVHSDAVWYISDEGSPNGFSGNIEMKMIWATFPVGMFTSVELHCVMHGFGTFAGQTLKLSAEPPGGASTGYLMKG